MAEHHLPPEPVVVGRPTKGVHAGDLKPRGRRYGYSNYYYGGGGGGLRSLVFAILVLLLIIGIIWLVLYIVYRPSDPTLAVTSAAVLALYNATTTGPTTFATTGPTTTTSAFTLLVRLRNPSSGGPPCATTGSPPTRGVPRGTPRRPRRCRRSRRTPAPRVRVPVLGGGGAVPVSNDAAAALAADVGYGVVPMRVVLLGRVKFLSGPFHGRWHSLYGRCDMLVGVRNNQQGGGGVAQAPLLGNPDCDVDT
ncbi:hypothetical protein PR202_ga04443 [Eleusine coracana subsp. coracana]|uniref:Late embryogenesis abundant protein LEA-2 subgroup domain-containing protein n=1 Tax=Eleusine coracana subsp. coracana TaxID=191504 RepID=A0AAV5BRS9_ELECO|nr:hypothetical protein PR202_ga04443 [Eleusine coracana subsp. coracana]